MEGDRPTIKEPEGKQEEVKFDLSQEEHKRLKHAFDSLDPEQTGKIDVEDLRFLLRCKAVLTQDYSLWTYRHRRRYKEYANRLER